MHAGDTGKATVDDIDHLFDIIDLLCSVLFTRAITLDRLIYQLSLPLAVVTKNSPRSTRAAQLIGDFFLLSLHDFICKYLSVLADRPPEQKQRLFRTKSRLSCALHFNYDLTEVELADERRGRHDEALAFEGVHKNTPSSMEETRLTDAPPIDAICTRRVSFVHHENTELTGFKSSMIDATRVLTIESFCPTFALYTVANLNSRFDLPNHKDRFIPADNSTFIAYNEETDYPGFNNIRPHLPSSSNEINENDEHERPHTSKKRARYKSHRRLSGDEVNNPFHDTRICLPPDAKSWHAFCQGGNDRNRTPLFWPKQVVLQHSHDIMNDRAMRGLLEHLTQNEDNVDNAVGLPDKRKKTGADLAVMGKSPDGNAGHYDTSPARLSRTPAALQSQRDLNLNKAPDSHNTHLFVERHWYTNDVESYVYQQRRQRHVNDSYTLSLNLISDFKHQYQLLLHRFSINWAKLHFMEPRVFTRFGNTEI